MQPVSTTGLAKNSTGQSEQPQSAVEGNPSLSTAPADVPLRSSLPVSRDPKKGTPVTAAVPEPQLPAASAAAAWDRPSGTVQVVVSGSGQTAAGVALGAGAAAAALMSDDEPMPEIDSADEDSDDAESD